MRAIGMDAQQILSTQYNAKNGWKTFHMDKINDTRLMTLEEIRSVFHLTDDRIDDDVHISN